MQHVNKLKSFLTQHGHSEKVLDYTMAKLFLKMIQNESSNYIAFVQTYISNTKFNKNTIHNSFNDFHDNSLKKFI